MQEITPTGGRGGCYSILLVEGILSRGRDPGGRPVLGWVEGRSGLVMEQGVSGVGSQGFPGWGCSAGCGEKGWTVPGVQRGEDGVGSQKE